MHRFSVQLALAFTGLDVIPSAQTRKLVKGYAAGVNAYLRDIGGSRNITDPACRGAAWVKPNATAKDIWYAVYAANLLASSGVFVPQIADAAPPSDLEGSSGAGAGFATPPSELPDRRTLLTRLGKDPDHPFGSNATAVGSASTTTKRGMLLGNPHFPWDGTERFYQAHLTVPGKLDAALQPSPSRPSASSTTASSSPPSTGSRCCSRPRKPRPRCPASK